MNENLNLLEGGFSWRTFVQSHSIAWPRYLRPNFFLARQLQAASPLERAAKLLLGQNRNMFITAIKSAFTGTITLRKSTHQKSTTQNRPLRTRPTFSKSKKRNPIATFMHHGTSQGVNTITASRLGTDIDGWRGDDCPFSTHSDLTRAGLKRAQKNRPTRAVGCVE